MSIATDDACGAMIFTEACLEGMESGTAAPSDPAPPLPPPQSHWVSLQRGSGASEGRFAVAQRDISLGELVHTSAPFVTSFNINFAPSAYFLLEDMLARLQAGTSFHAPHKAVGAQTRAKGKKPGLVKAEKTSRDEASKCCSSGGQAPYQGGCMSFDEPTTRFMREMFQCHKRDQLSASTLSTYTDVVCFHCMASTPKADYSHMVNAYDMVKTLHSRETVSVTCTCPPAPQPSSDRSVSRTLLQQLVHAEDSSDGTEGAKEDVKTHHSGRMTEPHPSGGPGTIPRGVHLYGCPDCCIAVYCCLDCFHQARAVHSSSGECAVLRLTWLDSLVAPRPAARLQSGTEEALANGVHGESSDEEGATLAPKELPHPSHSERDGTKGERRLALKHLKQQAKKSKKITAGVAQHIPDRSHTAAAVVKGGKGRRVRKMTEDDSVAMQLLVLVTLAVVRGARQGYLHRMVEGEDVDGDRTSHEDASGCTAEEPHAAEASCVASQPRLSGGPVDGSGEPPAGGLPQIETVSLVPKEVENIEATRRKLGLLNTVEVVDAAPGCARSAVAPQMAVGGEEELLDDDTWLSFARLVTNMSVISKDELSRFAKLHHLFQKRVEPRFEELLLGSAAALPRQRISPRFFYRVCAAVKCNGFGVFNSRNHCVAISVFPSASYLNHSCSPNLCRVMMPPRSSAASPYITPSTVGRVASFFALQPIAQGTPLTICYIDIEDSAAERRRVLLANYRFYCTCIRCSGTPSVAGAGEVATTSAVWLPRVPPLCRHCPTKGYLRRLPSSAVADTRSAGEDGECTVCRTTQTLTANPPAVVAS